MTNQTMTRVVFAAAVLSLAGSAPVFAGPVMSSPGVFSFYHPNLDVLDGGAQTPASRATQQARNTDAYDAMNSMGGSSCSRRTQDAQSGTFVGSDARRSRCNSVESRAL